VTTQIEAGAAHTYLSRRPVRGSESWRALPALARAGPDSRISKLAAARVAMNTRRRPGHAITKQPAPVRRCNQQ
jgi:hypothetical protein